MKTAFLALSLILTTLVAHSQKPEITREIADNIVSYQNADGGWPKNIRWFDANVRADSVKATCSDSYQRSTLDNSTVFPQVAYLASAYIQFNDERYRKAALAGIDYILSIQKPNGGWRGWDVDAITFNDDVMTGPLNLFLDIDTGNEAYTWIDKKHCEQIHESLYKGIDLVLRCQYKQNGRLTIWPQQADNETLEPVGARTFELPGLAATESAKILRLLMRLPNPSEEVQTSIHSAIDWLKDNAIYGIRIERPLLSEEDRKIANETADRVVVADEKAPRIWARYYNLDDNRPFFCGRDSKKKYNLAEIELERRANYGWYSYEAETTIAMYVDWVRQRSKVRIHTIGDSTMADKSLRKGNRERGWAQMLPGFLSEDVCVTNYAVNGRSSKSFIDEGRWQTVLDNLQPGDYVFIQFGHNDEKADEKRHTDPETTFAENLTRFVREAKAKGAKPVLFNSIVRRNFAEKTPTADAVAADDHRTYKVPTVQEGNVLVDTHGDYRIVPRKVAEREGVPFVDLNATTHNLVQNLGREGSKVLYMWIEPNVCEACPKGRQDNTHLNEHGGRVVAQLAIDAVAEQIADLKPYVRHYDIVVAKDGSGDFFKIADAMNAANNIDNKPVTLLIRGGYYDEKVSVSNKNITITYEKNVVVNK
ncbi:MAG: pectate lyase [Bacteroidales bacterium]|nr:pectate lyase [Bacteroidales bacterium]